MDRYELSEVNFGKNKYICFELFEVWFLIFFKKEESMRDIHNRDWINALHNKSFIRRS